MMASRVAIVLVLVFLGLLTFETHASSSTSPGTSSGFDSSSMSGSSSNSNNSFSLSSSSSSSSNNSFAASSSSSPVNGTEGNGTFSSSSMGVSSSSSNNEEERWSCVISKPEDCNVACATGPELIEIHMTCTCEVMLICEAFEQHCALFEHLCNDTMQCMAAEDVSTSANGLITSTCGCINNGFALLEGTNTTSYETECLTPFCDRTDCAYDTECVASGAFDHEGYCICDEGQTGDTCEIYEDYCFYHENACFDSFSLYCDNRFVAPWYECVVMTTTLTVTDATRFFTQNGESSEDILDSIIEYTIDRMVERGGDEEELEEYFEVATISIDGEGAAELHIPDHINSTLLANAIAGNGNFTVSSLGEVVVGATEPPEDEQPLEQENDADPSQDEATLFGYNQTYVIIACIAISLLLTAGCFFRDSICGKKKQNIQRQVSPAAQVIDIAALTAAAGAGAAYKDKKKKKKKKRHDSSSDESSDSSDSSSSDDSD